MAAAVRSSDRIPSLRLDYRFIPPRSPPRNQTHCLNILVISLLIAYLAPAVFTAEIVVDTDDVISQMFDVAGAPPANAAEARSIASKDDGSDNVVLLSHEDRHASHHRHHLTKPIDSKIPQQYPHDLISKDKEKNSDERASFTGVTSSNADEGNAEKKKNSHVSDDKNGRDHQRRQNDDDEDKNGFAEVNDFAVGVKIHDKHSIDYEDFPSNYAAFDSGKNYASNRVEFYVKNFDDDDAVDGGNFGVGEEKKKETTNEGNDIDGEKSMMESRVEEATRQPQVSWGIPDANAAVGAPFRFTIPTNAFLGMRWRWR